VVKICRYLVFWTLKKTKIPRHTVNAAWKREQAIKIWTVLPTVYCEGIPYNVSER
jgi:hypothetical protein